MNEKVGPKEAQVRALREDRAGRSKGTLKLLRKKIFDLGKTKLKTGLKKRLKAKRKHD